MIRRLGQIVLAASLAIPPSTALATSAPVMAQWERRPTQQQVDMAYPWQAKINRISGRAVLQCMLTMKARLQDCKVLEEYPADLAFGAAALSLVPAMKFRAARENDKAVDRIIDIPVSFGIPSYVGFGRLFTSQRQLSWTVWPSLQQMDAVYPEAAKPARPEGRVMLNCKQLDGGKIGNCSVIEETPVGLGFGETAIKLTPLLTAITAAPVGETVMIPVLMQPPKP